MKRLVLLGAAVAALVISLVTAGFSGSSAAPAKTTFTVIAQDSEATFTPSEFFRTPPTQNAQVSIDAPVYRDGEKVGLAETIVTITRANADDPAGIIECSVELPEGNLLFNGSIHLAELGNGVPIPVVGGTGHWAGTSGVVIMTAAPDGSSTQLTFKLRKN